jgi:hypothetical protein
MKIGAFYVRESYPLSHGNWERRWKVSLSNRKLRWTVKTNAGIKDLDSRSELVTNTYYHVVVTYSGSDFELYLNGELDAFTKWSGLILPTTVDLTIGQVLPENSSYNFNGVLDDIRIYDYGLSMNEIRALYDKTTSVGKDVGNAIPQHFDLEQNFPNPFNARTTIRFAVPAGSMDRLVSLRVYDVLGRVVATLRDGAIQPGVYTISWDAGHHPSGVYYCRLEISERVLVRRMLLVK